MANLRQRLIDINRTLNGDFSVARRQIETPPSISGRVETIVFGLWYTRQAPTQTQQDAYAISAEAFGPILSDLARIAQTEIPAIERQLEQAGAPWTPGRIPVWTEN